MLTEIIKKDIEEEIIPEFKEKLMSLAGKKVLITGGNGLIASYIIDTFAEINKQISNPIKVVILNKNETNEKSRLSHLLNDENFQFIACDVGKGFEIPENVNIIIHAASRANPKSFKEDPIDTIDANVNGTRIILEYLKNHKVDDFLLFSSFEIYGNPVSEFVPTPETYPGNVDCLDSMACYVESKRLAETLSLAFHTQYGTPVKMLRILLAYGPGMRDDGKVISKFFKKGLNKEEITIGGGMFVNRSFCYVSDTVKGIFNVMFNGKNGEAYNIGNDEENVNIKELAEKILNVVDNGETINIDTTAEPDKIYGVDNRDPNITKLRALGFKPYIRLDEGLRRLKSHYKEEDDNLH